MADFDIIWFGVVWSDFRGASDVVFMIASAGLAYTNDCIGTKSVPYNRFVKEMLGNVVAESCC